MGYYIVGVLCTLFGLSVREFSNTEFIQKSGPDEGAGLGLIVASSLAEGGEGGPRELGERARTSGGELPPQWNTCALRRLGPRATRGPVLVIRNFYLG